MMTNQKAEEFLKRVIDGEFGELDEKLITKALAQRKKLIETMNS